MRLLVASKNEKKRRELETILADLDVELVSLDAFPDAPDVDEDAETFAENAAHKALEYARWSGLMTVADDSGLCVDALDGRPGVYSARYAGGDRSTEALCRKLLGELGNLEPARRTARFRCAIALATPARVEFTVEGSVEGRITEAMRGTHGFGYDPVFLYEPAGRTFAELAPDEKNGVSHRGRALARFREKLAERLAP